MAPQTSIPLYPIGQQMGFWIPNMGLFELHNAKKQRLGSGVAPRKPIPLYCIEQQRCFWIPRIGVFELHKAKKYYLGSVVAPQTPIPRSPIGQQRCCWIPMMGCLNCTMPKFSFGFWGSAPNAHTAVPHKPAKVFLDTSDGSV